MESESGRTEKSHDRAAGETEYDQGNRSRQQFEPGVGEGQIYTNIGE